MKIVHIHEELENIATDEYGDNVHGSAIRVARQSRGLDIKELAELTQITAFKITKMEANKRAVTKSELSILSEKLKYPKNFFYQVFKPYKKFICSIDH